MSINSQSAKSAPDENFSNDFPALLEKAREISLVAISEAATTDAADSFPAQTFAAIAEAKILDAVIPENLGGAGLGTKAGTTFELLTLMKIFGYGNLVVGRIYEGHFNAWQLIGEYEKSDKFKKLADEAKRENHLFGVWNTEAGDGVKISSSEDSKKIHLQGAKTFASGVGYVSRPVVTGRLETGGWQMFVAPLETIETTIDDSFWKPLGMRSSRSYRIDFSGAEILAENTIGGADDYYRQPFFSGGAIRFAAVQLGAAELLFDLTRDFLRELNRTNDAFQQARLGEMAIAVESGNLWLSGAAKIFDEFLAERNLANVEKTIHYAGMMRTAIERICQEVMINCERSIGSRGLLKPYHFERVMRDLKMYLRQAAPDATLAGIGDFALQTNRKSIDLWREND